MRIKEISLKNFKRFTDLTIKDIPESAKLVLLIGANGSGKSSVFDAFEYYNNRERLSEDNYYDKIPTNQEDLSIEFILDKGSLKTAELQFPGLYLDGKGYHDFYTRHWSGTGIFDLQKNVYSPAKNVFYGRTSIKVVSRIPSPDLQKSVEKDADRPEHFIDQDIRFNTDVYEYIREVNTAIRSPFFKGEKSDIPTITREYLTNLNDSFQYILGENKTAIQLIDIVDSIPGVPAKLIFKKGDSEINYDLLSHGEKQIVTLLLNFVVRNKYYQDTIYFVDEMDTHLETTIQKRLIEDVVKNWIPNGSQLWTASHALGFIEYANKDENSVILDFDNLDFDVPQVLVPSRKDSLDVYEIALPKSQIASILKGYKLVAVENKNDVQLNEALGQEGYIFLPANNNREVFLTIKGDKDKLGLRDRDYLKDSEIAAITKAFPNFKILPLYTFENYLYHPDNLMELALDGYDRDEYINEISRQKQEKLIAIVSGIGIARTHYVEFKEGIQNDGKIEEITDSLQSKDFNVFYTFFNMKEYFNKVYLNKFEYTISQLAQTNWFKSKMKEVLS